MTRKPFTQYHLHPLDDLQGDLEPYILEDLGLCPQKVAEYARTEERIASRADPAWLANDKNAIFWWRQIDIHEEMFNTEMRGYSDHERFEPYHAVIEHINKGRKDHGIDLVIATARGDHLTSIDQQTGEFVRQFFGADVTYAKDSQKGSCWMRTNSSGDKPTYLEGVGAWYDDDMRNKKLNDFLQENDIFIVKRVLPFNLTHRANALVVDPYDPHQPGLEEMFRYCKSNGITRIGTDLDDAVRPFRRFQGEAAKLYGKLHPERVERLRKE